MNPNIVLARRRQHVEGKFGIVRGNVAIFYSQGSK